MQDRSAALRMTVALFAAVLTTAIVHQARATVTWSFFETGISCFTGPSCTLPPQPFVFATLTLPGPISEGTALWRGAGFSPPVYTGDEFVFSFDFGLYRLTPAFNGDQGGAACGFSVMRLTICDFDISWSATASELSIAITFDAAFDAIFRFRTNQRVCCYGYGRPRRMHLQQRDLRNHWFLAKRPSRARGFVSEFGPGRSLRSLVHETLSAAEVIIARVRAP